MTRFLVSRVAQGILVLWAVSVAVFLLFFAGHGPNQVARTFAGRFGTAARIAQIKRELHLDQPLYLQYLHWVGNVLRGDLGQDYYKGEPVTSAIAAAAPATISLVLGAAVLWISYGILSGVISAVKPRSLLDRGFTSAAVLFYSIPTFVLGLALIWIFAYKLSPVTTFFPFHGYVPITASPLGWFEHLILPWITLALVTSVTYTRLSRASMLEVLGEDYIRTARSKGMPERRVIVVHALRPSQSPVVTQAGLDIGTALGGVIITETVFGIPGLGWTAVQAITQQDLPIIVGIVVLAAAFIVLANILVDIIYAVLDPRVRVH